MASDIFSCIASDLRTSWNCDDLLGSGSFGTVRKCEHSELGQVVVKCFPVVGSRQKYENSCEIVNREVKVMQRLHHENVVILLGTTRWRNCVGILMEYIDGGNLEDLLKDETIAEIPWSLRFHIFQQIANGLSHLHYHDEKRAVVHGDLKPQNILLTSDFTVKIADFGSANIAKATGVTTATSDLEVSNQLTPYYTPPEVLKEPLKERKRSMDVYSFGIIGYEILTRRGAFEECLKPQLVIQVIKDMGQKPNQSHLTEVKEALSHQPEYLNIFNVINKVMMTCWNYNPTDRPDIQDVCTELSLEGKKLSKNESDCSKVKEMQKLRQNKLLKNQSSAAKVELSDFSHPFEQVHEPTTKKENTENVEVVENRNLSRLQADSNILPDNVLKNPKWIGIVLFLLAALVIPMLNKVPQSEVNAPKCPNLQLPDFVNADCSDGNKRGSTCQFSCTDGRVISGSPSTFCEETLTWTSEPPSCVCPKCKTGSRCTDSASWNIVKTHLPDTPWGSSVVNYAGYSIKCRVNKHGGLFSFKWDCTCTDVSSSHSHRCNDYESPGGSCEHALAYLIRDMFSKGIYPEPCDASSMPHGC